MTETTKDTYSPGAGVVAGRERTVVLAGIHARFTLAPAVSWDEATATLELARLAVESLFGPGRVALEDRWRWEPSARTVTIDATTEVGRALVLIFGGYAEREFGTDAVAGRVVPGPLA